VNREMQKKNLAGKKLLCKKVFWLSKEGYSIFQIMQKNMKGSSVICHKKCRLFLP
jgi:hypothetical protein